MRLRENSTTSERELLTAMEICGRAVALTTLVEWRKDGFLPPFLSVGRGQGKGRSYYWRETHIVEHASRVYDLQKKYKRVELIITHLWLSGFNVQIKQFRRALNHRTRRQKLFVLNPGPKNLAHGAGVTVKGKRTTTLTHGKSFRPEDTFLNIALAILKQLSSDAETYEIKRFVQFANSVVTRIGIPSSDLQLTGAILDHASLFGILCILLETSNLVSESSDDEMLEARELLLVFAKFAEACRCAMPAVSDKTPSLEGFTDTFDVPLFLLILALRKIGFQRPLSETADQLGLLVAHWASSSSANSEPLCGDEPKTLAKFRDRMGQTWRGRP